MIYLRTVPFANPNQLAIHFAKHGRKFGLSSEQDYEEMADAFMSMPMSPDLHECISPYGAFGRNRLQASTLYFGVAVKMTVIKTFHIKDAAGVALRGGPGAFVAHKCAEVHW